MPAGGGRCARVAVATGAVACVAAVVAARGLTPVRLAAATVRAGAALAAFAFSSAHDCAANKLPTNTIEAALTWTFTEESPWKVRQINGAARLIPGRGSQIGMRRVRTDFENALSLGGCTGARDVRAFKG